MTIDVKTTLHGEDVAEASRSDYLYFVGSGEFGSKLDDELVSTKPGDILKVNDALPDALRRARRHRRERPGPGEGREAAQAPRGRRRVREDGLGVRHADAAPRRPAGAARRDEGARRRRRHPRPRAAGHDRHRRPWSCRTRSSRRRPSTASRTPGSAPSGRGSRSSRCWSPRAGTRRGCARIPAITPIRAIKSDLVLEGIARTEKLEVTAEEIGPRSRSWRRRTAASRRSSGRPGIVRRTRSSRWPAWPGRWSTGCPA